MHSLQLELRKKLEPDACTCYSDIARKIIAGHFKGPKAGQTIDWRSILITSPKSPIHGYKRQKNC